MKVLVIGSGAREHALLWKLSQSDLVTGLIAAPGNAGIAALAQCIPVGDNGPGPDWYADLAEQHAVDLTIVGPESLLIEGIVDVFESRGLRVFGPTAAAARLEGSKVWAKELMQRVGIPTASWRAFEDLRAAREHAAQLGWDCVIKTDGPAAGKGSFVCSSEAEVDEALAVLRDRYPGTEVLVEETLEGQEVSVFAITDGKVVVPFGAAQDHKRARDRDTGLNTGGMGAYSPVQHMKVAQDFATGFFEPLVAELAAKGIPYVGVLYAGALITPQGPKILEFNCRFGDPESEVLFCRLESDLAEIIFAATERKLELVAEPQWTTKDALCVVIATERYPHEGDLGAAIEGLDEAEALDDVIVFHAGTGRDPVTGQLITHGGRILSVTGLGDNLAAARRRAYEAVSRIHFPDMYFRQDIGAKALGSVWSTFQAERHKPPQWEIARIQTSRALTEVATDLAQLSLDAVGAQTTLRGVRERVLAIQRGLNPVFVIASKDRTSEDEPHGSPSDYPPELDEGLRALLERMQRPEVGEAIDSVFRSDPKDLAKRGDGADSERKRD